MWTEPERMNGLQLGREGEDIEGERRHTKNRDGAGWQGWLTRLEICQGQDLSVIQACLI